jgi:hypothetical protein
LVIHRVAGIEIRERIEIKMFNVNHGKKYETNDGIDNGWNLFDDPEKILTRKF